MKMNIKPEPDMKTRSGRPTMAVGRRGEDEACGFLVKKGHVLIQRNYRAGHLEIDIISLDRNGVHFVEVKSRVAPAQAEPQESVTPAKQRRIAEAAKRYLNASKDSRLRADLEVSFDVVAVTFEKGETRIDWFPGAYIPMYF